MGNRRVAIETNSTYTNNVYIPGFIPQGETGLVPLFGYATSSVAAVDIYRESLPEGTPLVPFNIEFRGYEWARGPQGNIQEQQFNLSSVVIIDEDDIPLGMSVDPEFFTYIADTAWNDPTPMTYYGVKLKFYGNFAPNRRGMTITSRLEAYMPTTTHNPEEVIGQIVDFKKDTNLSRSVMTFRVIDEIQRKYFGKVAVSVYPVFGEPWAGFPDPYTP